MAHTYTTLTKSDNTYTAVSDVTPITGVVEEKLTWAYVEAHWATWNWLELLSKVHWCDWWFATKFVDAWTSITTPAYTYSEVTK